MRLLPSCLGLNLILARLPENSMNTLITIVSVYLTICAVLPAIIGLQRGLSRSQIAVILTLEPHSAGRDMVRCWPGYWRCWTTLRIKASRFLSRCIGMSRTHVANPPASTGSMPAKSLPPALRKSNPMPNLDGRWGMSSNQPLRSRVRYSVLRLPARSGLAAGPIVRRGAPVHRIMHAERDPAGVIDLGRAHAGRPLLPPLAV